MIKTLLFDFGDVFINLDKTAPSKALAPYGLVDFTPEMHSLNEAYEIGEISTASFLKKYQRLFPEASIDTIKKAWNSILLDFPKYRLDFLQKIALSNDYQLILLSNTNALHIESIQENVPFFESFKQCFDHFYVSHEIGLRKPNKTIFDFVLTQHKLVANEVLFIDDTKENTDCAKSLGIHVWNNDPINEDVISLFKIKKELF